MDIIRKNYFKAIVGAFDGPVYVCSSDNTIEYVNQKVIDEMGRDITGQHCFKALHGCEKICSWCKEQEVFKGKTVRWEFEHPKTGKWFNYMTSPIFHSDGSVSKLTLCADITENKLLEKALTESTRKLTTLMGNLSGMVYRCKTDAETSMEFASKGCYKLLGYKASELIGKSTTAYQHIVPPQDRKNLLRCVAAALDEKRSYSFIYRVKKATGEIIWVWEQGEGVFSDSGKLMALEGFITNVTEQKKVELDLRNENTKLKNSFKDRYKFGNIVGKSDLMQAVYDLILHSSSNNANIIIYGESGTGKELVAHSIHNLSDRKKNAFVAVNCGAINENLIESEFFGYKKGAFTGASSDTLGYFDKSDGGSLFLDELGEMSMSMQVKLLRAIEGQGYTPVGGNSVKTSDFRIIAATNQNLKELIKNKRMREDFYYRIHILPIFLPPLRERKEDIPLLIDHFIQIYPNKDSKKITMPNHIREAFNRYDWPGNVRELQNAVYRYLTLGEIVFINEEPMLENNLYENFHKDISGSQKGLDIVMAQLEKKIILKTLEKFQWNRGKTAEYLNIDRKTLYRKIKTLDVIIHK